MTTGHPTPISSCDNCPVTVLSELLKEAVLANQQALNSIARLHQYWTQKSAYSAEFLESVNRIESLSDGRSFALPLVSELDAYDLPSVDKGLAPIWYSLSTAAKKIFEQATTCKLHWLSVSVNPPKPGAELRSALGFDDIVVLHSNQNLGNGADHLFKRKSDHDFLTISSSFFESLRNSPEIEDQGGIGLWVRNGTSSQSEIRRADGIVVLDVNLNMNNELTIDNNLEKTIFGNSVRLWHKHYSAHPQGIAEYYESFRALSDNEATDMLFCPILYVDADGTLAAGANISIGFSGSEVPAATDFQIRNLFLACSVLQAGVASAVAAFQQANEQMRQLDRSRQMLAHLGRPLERMTRAFEAVQLEQQEMRSILYDPEDVLFSSSNSVAEIFDESTDISLAEGFSVRCIHDFRENPVEELRSLYAILVSRIFGLQDQFGSIRSHNALADEFKHVMKSVRDNVVFKPIVDLLDGIAEKEFQDVLDFERREIEEVLLRIKSLTFLPFKKFDTALPIPALRLASDPVRVSDLDWIQWTGERSRMPFWSPVSANGILQFLVSIRKHRRSSG